MSPCMMKNNKLIVATHKRVFAKGIVKDISNDLILEKMIRIRLLSARR